jgi:T4 RnlA family RNA ligase
MEAEVFIANKPWYKEFMELCHAQGLMPIFEYVSPETRIVIHHKEPNLILTAIRNQITGEYLPYLQMLINAKYWNIPHVNDVYRSSSFLQDDIIKKIENASDTEGVVVRFDNGHMVKVKTLWYVAIHRAKDNLLHEKRVVELILEDKVDDVLGFLDPEDRDRLDAYRTSFVNGLDATKKLLIHHYYPKAKSMSRKDFALGFGKDIPGCYASIIFSCWDKGVEHIEGEVLEVVKKSLTSQAKIDKTRHLWGNAVWSFKVMNE